MSNDDRRIVIYVTYVGEPSDRFDRAYYEETHLPLVLRAWKKYGLLGATAYFPSRSHTGTRCICECVFRNETAVHTAFASPEAPFVMADVIKFTDLLPIRVHAVPL
ncbi:EthD family reductase [Luteibacter pinisoli]|uniref:EthD family reductase n=1 Tax=Luteibacter pinisoli TaxID=2589080 RepID=A0A4Y5YY15_9GAMM|nr:EthD family reductase [Luteibacter pinisoli]QDE37737.1 EthD family reductase [Luteibacter pinisoli]